MTRSLARRRNVEAMALPAWIKPQLTKLVDQPPDGPDWLHEIKFDGYRMHASRDRGAVLLLTRTSLDWTHKYSGIAAAVASLPARQAYLDGELCGVRPDGTTSFSLIQNASDTGNGDALVFFLFDLLHLVGESIGARPLTERKERLRELLSHASAPLQFSDHQIGRGRAFYDHACGLKLEGIVSKRADVPYAPGNRGLWLKVKCLNREEFVVVGWTDPEGTRPWLGALLLAYYDPAGRLIYAGRVGTGIDHAELERLWRRLQPLAAAGMPLDRHPPRTNRFGSPLVLSRVHWVRPELVVEVKYLTWTDDNLLRLVAYERSARGQGSDRRPASRAEPYRPREARHGRRSYSPMTRGISRGLSGGASRIR